MNAPVRFVVPPLLRTLAATWRFVEWDEEGRPGPRRRRLDPVVLALWHSELLALMLGYGHLGIASMASRHGDGELAAAVLGSLGATTVRGSSSRGGSAALRRMVELGPSDLAFAITTDGPRGPARRSKPGIVRLAARTGRPIVAVAGRPEAGWRLDSWDRFIIPRPFTRVHTTFGSPIFVSTEPEGEELDAWLRRVDEAVDEASARCAEHAGVEER